MNKRFFYVYMCLLSLATVYSVEEEFIKQPKEKKISISCQQYIELEAEIVQITNAAIAQLAQLQGTALADINGYMCSDKDCFINSATKKQRSQAYTQKMKEKDELRAIVHKLSILIA